MQRVYFALFSFYVLCLIAVPETLAQTAQSISIEASDRFSLGDALYHSKDLRNAASAFQQALVINPKFDQAYFRLAETLLAMHQREQARQVCVDGLRTVSDANCRQQLEVLLKVSSYEVKPPVRSHEVRPNHMPSES